MHMNWHDLAFLHWPVDCKQLASLLPSGLELDTFEGQAYLGIVPFEMRSVFARRLPEIPFTNIFLELNVRTYVRHGDRRGVWFFSLDAANALAVWGARRLFHLPYFCARMSSRWSNGFLEYQMVRNHPEAYPAHFHAKYRPTGPVYRSQPGTLEHWLTERYCLFSQDRRFRLHRAEIVHRPWALQPAEVEISTNNLHQEWGIHLTDSPPLSHFVRFTEVLGWTLDPLLPYA